MKKYQNIFKAGIFILILCCLIGILSYVFTPKNNFKEFGMENVEINGILGEKENTIDVLFMGDSEVYASFSPMQMYDEYGFTSHDLGTGAQRLYDTYNYLKRTLKKQKPKVIVLETNIIFRKFSMDRVFSGELKNLLPFIKYHNRWKTLTINDFTSGISYTYTSPLKGFKTKEKIISRKKYDYMKKNKKEIFISKKNTYYLNKIKDICNEEGIELLLVSSPSISNWDYAKHSATEKYAQKNDLSFIDLNLIKEVVINWEHDSYDEGDHLNYYGAKKVSSYIGKYLSEHYSLENHKDDKNYKKWNDDLVRYKEQYN